MKSAGKHTGHGKLIRVGIIGISRGLGFARGAGETVGMKLVALCDQWEEKLKTLKSQFPGVALYTDYDKFLEHDMDAVILANYFHQHAPFAVKALNAGFHVMSETGACHTLGEASALVDAVERSGNTYMLAENYCFFAYNQEMRRLYRAREIGEMRLGEGEYIHPDTEQARLARSPGLHHWRNWTPPTYYCTHALGPIMYITDTRPTAVNARSIDYGNRAENWSPFPEDAGPGQPPPSIVGFRKASRAELASTRQIWKAQGYTGE